MTPPIPPRAPLFLLLPLLLACGARTELPICLLEGQQRTCETICGTGVETCVGGEWTTCTAPRPSSTLPIEVTLRDFSAAHPDFEELAIGLDLGIVAPTLGPDDKPVYAGNPTTPTTSGQSNFDQWFRDIPGVNATAPFTLELSATPDEPSVYRFEAPDCFPIDGQLLGNEGNSHNFHFTLEMQIPFRYVGGESLTFRGDDDLWVFINRRLAIDLGGVHSQETATVSLDDAAATLGITQGEIFPFALFFAERHTTGSNFYLETTITEFALCPP
ncbi:fibro-slime domain-containing protein [Polyangium aurulentum]|uniref:fibro-slime domain-containing protein n=1 Tax=Polyangium aurulentum TaxID=2567896 RepID=UPI0010ADF84A|nr:fibro-slime domain-containing protein [Polyangium aurulentum]UQA57157.1 fibro-slime domain-containing protein [Polyangium aurulentum]